MSEEVVARRYARALFDLAVEKNILQQIEADLTGIRQVLAESKELQTFLQHPQTDAAVKKDKIKSIFSGKVSEYVLSLMLLLIDRRRESILSEVADEFVGMSNRANNVVDAEIVSAVPLDEQELLGIAERFGKKINKTLRMKNDVDPAIVGGLVIRIGDRIYDGSIKGKLARFKQSLA